MKTECLLERLKALPDRPGVYLLRDEPGHVLYVGKAASLRSRVRSYFGPSQALSPKLQKMVARVRDLDFMVTDNEAEALILECNLIKKHRPHYNVRLKDDKSYPYLKVATNEDWPRVYITRRFLDDGARYFGPFASAKSLRKTLDLLKKLFRFCSPPRPITGKAKRPCFDYYIGRCQGACSGEVSRQEYREAIDQVILFLEGRQERVLADLEGRMRQAAESLDFEKAARLRDQIRAVQRAVEHQKIVSTTRGDQDVIAFAREQDEALVQVFFIRGGKLIGGEHFLLEGARDEEPGAVLASFVEQFYGSAPYVPPQILLQAEPDHAPVLREWLSGRRGRRVQLKVPQRGESRKLVAMAAENAGEVMEQLKVKWLTDTGRTAAALGELEEQLRLPRLPRRVECYDISDIRGASAVGSMVVFEDGRPRSSDYRRFRIRTAPSADDYAMMQEVLRRRFRRSQATEATTQAGPWGVIPDLVLIDGGRGHLNAAVEALQEQGVEGVPVASIAKEKEEIFLPQAAEAVILSPNSQSLYLLQRIRDEAHRFALSYHLKVRERRATTSALDLVPGIGPRRKRGLLKRFGSLRAVKEASFEELAAVPGMTRALAERIREYL